MERAEWADKLMGRYGSEKSRKDKEEKDTHFGTMVDCSWLLSNFGRKKRMNVERSAITSGRAEFTFEHDFCDRTKRGYEKVLRSLS